eukprot:scaffold300_cov173-Ochromonas_danica.AAC.11
MSRKEKHISMSPELLDPHLPFTIAPISLSSFSLTNTITVPIDHISTSTTSQSTSRRSARDMLSHPHLSSLSSSCSSSGCHTEFISSVKKGDIITNNDDDKEEESLTTLSIEMLMEMYQWEMTKQEELLQEREKLLVELEIMRWRLHVLQTNLNKC